MLRQNHIPEQEPVVSIGIILPEDKTKELVIEVPIELIELYTIQIAQESFPLRAGSVLRLALSGNKIQADINGNEPYVTEKIRLVPQGVSHTLKPKSGLKIKNVISGRDFHWHKRIDVYLPDILTVRVEDHFLFLANDLPLEHYLMCVATSEMNAACPKALVESQTITARSWILAAVEQKHKDLGIDACNDDCCQRYQGTTYLSEQSIAGSLNTSGLVALYDGQICDARYSKSCGGMMESYDSIWEDKTFPYLQVIPDAKTTPKELITPLSVEKNFRQWVNAIPDTFCSSKELDEQTLKQYLGTVDEHGKYFRWQRYVSQQDITEAINLHHGVNAKAVLGLNILKRGGGGRIISMSVTYKDEKGVENQLMLKKDFSIRQSLDKSFLYSSAFIINKEEDLAGVPGGFNFTGAGWGHGVGYCQIGALSMSLQGYSTELIMAHYFPGSEVKKIY